MPCKGFRLVKNDNNQFLFVPSWLPNKGCPYSTQYNDLVTFYQAIVSMGTSNIITEYTLIQNVAGIIPIAILIGFTLVWTIFNNLITRMVKPDNILHKETVCS